MATIDRLWRNVKANIGDFNSWISLLELAEKQTDIEKARKPFDSFFEHYPYCYGYWKKYADLERHAGNKERCLEIYAKGVEAIPLSIDLWTAYLDATMEIIHGQDDYEIRMRSLYELALTKAGMEFRSDALWEHYISWESGHNRLKNVLAIYDRLLKMPTQLYFQNWDSFKKLIEDNKPDDVLSQDEFCILLARVSPAAAASVRISQVKEKLVHDESESHIPPSKKHAYEITEEDRSAIRQFVLDSREKIYQATYLQIMKRWYFEEKIRRPYFHVKPLEEAQLYNWAEYLSFEEAEAAMEQSNYISENPDADPLLEDGLKLAKKRVRVLYERCLVACALYEHMWIRYAKYLEYTESDIPASREVWRRACLIHLPCKPTIHWHFALFEDRHPACLDSLDEGSEKVAAPTLNSLEILTKLEQRLPDSALVCARRADAMRRFKKPLLDIIICIRSGINRLRLRAAEQANLAHTVSGPTSSMSAAIALATSAQARAGASYLAAKLARMLHRNVNSLVPLAGIPAWQLLLSSAYKIKPEESDESSLPKSDEDNSSKPDVETITDSCNPDTLSTEPIEDSALPKEINSVNESDSKTVVVNEAQHEIGQRIEEDMEAEEVTPETIKKLAPTVDDDIEMETADSPPVVLVRTKSTPPIEDSSKDVQNKESVKVEEVTSPKPEAAPLPPKEQKRKRKTRWGSESDLLAAKEEEEQRLALADADAKEYAESRESIIYVRPPPISGLTEEDKALLTSEQSAIAILKEAIEYDSRNERLFAQLLDIAYQRRPLDMNGFLELADFAIVESLLPATIKLSFSQRKLQFLEEFGDDLTLLNTAYDEYVSLSQLVSRCTINRQTGLEATRAYTTPDLLNVVLPAPLRPSARHNPVTNGPVRKMPRLNNDVAVLEDAASVGTPIPAPQSAAALFTAGAYEPFAGAQGVVSGLPPPAIVIIPTEPPMGLHGLGLDTTQAVESVAPRADLWPPTTGAAPVAGAYYYPAAGEMSSGMDFTVPAPPPAPPLTLSNTKAVM